MWSSPSEPAPAASASIRLHVTQQHLRDAPRASVQVAQVLEPAARAAQRVAFSRFAYQQRHLAWQLHQAVSAINQSAGREFKDWIDAMLLVSRHKAAKAFFDAALSQPGPGTQNEVLGATRVDNL